MVEISRMMPCGEVLFGKRYTMPQYLSETTLPFKPGFGTELRVGMAKNLPADADTFSSRRTDKA